MPRDYQNVSPFAYDGVLVHPSIITLTIDDFSRKRMQTARMLHLLDVVFEQALRSHSKPLADSLVL